MSHLVLLGDSVFDNAAYTGGQPDVISHVRRMLPSDWKATLGAIDGSTTDEIRSQLASLPPDATHLALSVGGNDAILRADVLEKAVTSSGEAFQLLGEVADGFEIRYQAAVSACLATGLPLVLCTIYHGNFEDEMFRKRAIVAVTLFNDAILRTAIDNGLVVVDLRFVCSAPIDFANPIEPSTVGGEKIARAILGAVNSEQLNPGGARIAT